MDQIFWIWNWAPSSVMNTPHCFTKICEKASQKAGIYPHTMSIAGGGGRWFWLGDKWGEGQDLQMGDKIPLYSFFMPPLVGLRISYFLSQRLTIKLFDLICWEWSWSSFPLWSPGGWENLYFRLDIILVKELSKYTLNTYFSGMKIDPKHTALTVRFPYIHIQMPV